jgi:hypothetical protein
MRTGPALPRSSTSDHGVHSHVPTSTGYIGGIPQAGPFTTLDTVGMTSVNPQTSGAVPLSPQNPSDITAPVEMAESEASQAGSPPAHVPGGTPSPRGGRRMADYFTSRQSRFREMEGGSPAVELPATPLEKH